MRKYFGVLCVLVVIVSGALAEEVMVNGGFSNELFGWNLWNDPNGSFNYSSVEVTDDAEVFSLILRSAEQSVYRRDVGVELQSGHDGVHARPGHRLVVRQLREAPAHADLVATDPSQWILGAREAG